MLAGVRRALGPVIAWLAFAGCRSSEPPSRDEAAKPVAAPASAAPEVDPWAPRAPTPLPPPRVTQPFEHPFLWVAEKDGHATYLFGTLHGGLDAERRIPLWVWKQFEAAPALVQEVNLHDVTLTQWTVRPAGSTLRAELDEATWRSFEQAVTPPQAAILDHQATSVAILRLSGYGGGRDVAPPMEGEFLVRAEGLAKPREFLETPALQGEMFHRVLGRDMIGRLLARRGELPALNRAFFDAYIAGDEQRLVEVSRAQFRLHVDSDAALDALLEGMLLERNRAWIPALEKIHAAGGAFVTVGVLHLIGDHDVLDLLRARGFAVRRAEAP